MEIRKKYSAFVFSMLVLIAPLPVSAQREGHEHEMRGHEERGHEMRIHEEPEHERHERERHERDMREHETHERQWHQGNIQQFHINDHPNWRAGNWFQGHHEGRDGWWWIVGNMWYYYPRAVYPYPDAYTPPTVIVEPVETPAPPAPPAQVPGPQAQYWYYCESSKTYYPYVASCDEGWQQVPATAPPQ